jgi:16S rRNA (cytosine967-C5)-methyltransferase
VTRTDTARSPRPGLPPGAPASLPLQRLLGHAADAVGAVLAGRSLTDALAACPAPARPGTQALAFHALRQLGGAQRALAHLAPRKPPPEVQSLLLCALALLWPQDDPEAAPPSYADHTLVDQAVACMRLRRAASAGFVNAVLRRFQRERASLVPAWQAEDPVVRWQHPRWWIERLQRDWPEHWQALLTTANRAAPMALRVNARQTDAVGYLAELAAQGIDAEAVGSHALVLTRPVPVTALPGFATGRVSVQDLSAQIAAPLLLGEGADRLPPGARVLDACAAPGGKTAHLLEMADLDLLALDVEPERLARVDETLQRCGLKAGLRAADAARVADWWDGRPFDAILLDAPCSASGIVRRHPDVRWLRRPADIDTLVRTQAGLLDALWPLLKPGGRLVYATCSVFRAEGDAQLAAFLQRTADARTQVVPGHRLGIAENRSATAGEATGQPAIRGDGFFYARLDKPS